MVISGTVAGAVGTFIDGALVVVGVLIVWYIGKFFFVQPPTEADRAARRTADEERAHQARDWVTGRMQQGRQRREQQQEQHRQRQLQERRENQVRHLRHYIVEAMDTAREVTEVLQRAPRAATAAAQQRRTEVLHHYRELQQRLHRHLDGAHMALRRARRVDHHFFNPLFDLNATAMTAAERLLEEAPEAVAAGVQWEQEVAGVEELTNSIRTTCGQIFNNLDQYIEQGAQQQAAQQAHHH